MEVFIIHVNQVGEVWSSLPAVYWVFIDKKTKSTSVGSHAALSSQWGPSHVKLHFIVSMEHISPSKRKGYFLHHPPLTTTSARSCHVLERGDKAKKKKKEPPAEKPLLTLAQHLNPKCSSPGLLSGSVVKPLPWLWFTGRNGMRSSLTQRHQVACWRWRWQLRSMISQAILWTLTSDKRNKTITAFLNDHSIFDPTLLSPQLEVTPHFKPHPREKNWGPRDQWSAWNHPVNKCQNKIAI